MAELLYINGSGTDLYGQSYFGQRITPDTSWIVSSIWIDTMYASSAGDAYCYIYADSGSGPTGSAIATSDANAVAGSPGGSETFTFSSPPTLSSGVPYWVVFHRAGAAIYGYRTTSSVYADGNIGYTTHSTDPTQAWNDNTLWDIRQFKVNGTTAPTSFTSVTSGEWDSPVTWGHPASATEYYPAKDGDDVTITAGDTVTYSISGDAQIDAILIYGTLTFAPSANTLLRTNQNNGYIILDDGGPGTLNVGTSAAPIHKDYTCEITTVGTANAAHGFSIQEGGTFNVYGDSDYYGGITYSRLAVSGDGGNIVALEDDVSGWNIGDEIVIHNHKLYDDDWYGNNTLTTIVGISGTSVQCADVISTNYGEGGLVQHLTRNVKIYREGYTKVLDGTLPGGDGNHYQIDSDQHFVNTTFNFYDVEIASCYRINNLDSPVFNGVVFRNAYYHFIGSESASLYNCNFHVFRYLQYTTHNSYYNNCTSTCNLNNMVVFSMDNKFVDCIFTFNDYMIYSLSRFATFLRCELTGTFPLGQCSEVYYIDCAFPGMVWPTYSGLSYDVYFHNCKFGWDLADREVPVNTMWYTAWGDSHFNNCKFQSETENYRNNSANYYCVIRIKDYNQVEGDDRIIFNKADAYVVDADGTDSNPTQRSSGESRIYRLETLSYSSKARKENILRHKFYVSNTNQKTIRYYIQTDYTNGLSNEEAVLECVYPTTSSVDTQVSAESIAIRSNQSDWSQYVEVIVTPEVAGWIELNLFVGSYESGKYIWVDPKLEVT